MNGAGASDNALPATRSGRKRKATAKLAQSHVKVQKRTAKSFQFIHSAAVQEERETQSKAANSQSLSKRSGESVRLGKLGLARRKAAKARMIQSTEASLAKKKREVAAKEGQSEIEKHLDGPEKHYLLPRMPRILNSRASAADERSKHLRDSANVAVADGSHRESSTPVGSANQRSIHLWKTRLELACQTETSKQQARVEHDPISGGNGGCPKLASVPLSARKESTRNAPRLTRANHGSPIAVDTIKAAMAAAKKAQSVTLNVVTVARNPTTDTPNNHSAGRQVTVCYKRSASRKPGSIPQNRSRAVPPGKDVIGHTPAPAHGDPGMHGGGPSQQARLSSDTPQPTTSARDKRQYRSTAPRNKDAVFYLSLMNRNLQQFINDHNEHNKAVRGVLARMETQRNEDRQAEKDRHEDVCRLLNDIGNGHEPNVVKEISAGKDRFTLSMVEGCCAMLRFVYSMAGRGEISAQYMYPTTKTQEALIQFIVRAVLISEGLKDPKTRQEERNCSNNIAGAGVGNINIDAQLPALEIDCDSGTACPLPSGDAAKFALSRHVKTFLGSKISTANSISVVVTTATAEDNLKNSVKSRLLDQRRRFHDYITAPILNKWLQTCVGFEAFDTSLKTLKQDPSVFRAAADIFEKDDDGFRPYLETNVHGTSFYDACVMLKRICADHTERAVAQALKALRDSGKVHKLCEIVLNHVDRNTCYDGEMGSPRRQRMVFFPHQLAFVQTKIHARLEWLSHCKLFGGKSHPKPDRSHYGVYLRYVIGFNEELHLKNSVEGSELCMRSKGGPNGLSSSQDCEVYILGVPLLPLLKNDITTFMTEFYGDHAPPIVSKGIAQVSKARGLAHVDASRRNSNAAAMIGDVEANNAVQIEQREEHGTGSVDNERQRTYDNQILLEDEDDYSTNFEDDSYYEEESDGL